MKGQKKIIEYAKSLIDSKSYPRFSIFIGKKGSGKKTLAKEISKLMGIDFVIWDNKIDDIRELIKFMWDQKQEIMYCIPDYEDMSMGARNALLKVCEEPPNNAFIVMTSSSNDIIIPTILNRGTVFELSGYTEEELRDIEIEKGNEYDSEGSLEKLVQLCEVPGDLDIARNMNVAEFIDFMNDKTNIRLAVDVERLEHNRIFLCDILSGYDGEKGSPMITEEQLDALIGGINRTMRDPGINPSDRMTAGICLLNTQLGLRNSEIPAMRPL